MPGIRTFIAILLPDEIRSRLAEVEERLVRADSGVKWVAPENFHITVKFLGGVEPGKLERLCNHIREAVSTIECFEIELGGAGAFPKLSRPSVVWVGITSGLEPLRQLAHKVDVAVEKLGFPREQRPFSGHVTLGRTREPSGHEKLRDAIEQLKGEPIGAVRVGSVAVMKSDLRPTGPVYSAMKHISLK